MGWTTLNGYTRKELADKLTDDSPEALYRCESRYFCGNDMWSLWVLKSDEARATPADRFIRLDKLQKLTYGWGYKTFDESAHPYVYSCPLSFLAKSAVVDSSWRERVIMYWDHRRALGAKKRAKKLTSSNSNEKLNARG